MPLGQLRRRRSPWDSRASHALPTYADFLEKSPIYMDLATYPKHSLQPIEGRDSWTFCQYGPTPRKSRALDLARCKQCPKQHCGGICCTEHQPARVRRCPARDPVARQGRNRRTCDRDHGTEKSLASNVFVRVAEWPASLRVWRLKCTAQKIPPIASLRTPNSMMLAVSSSRQTCAFR